MSLADRIKECRVERGLSQAELAERLCVSRQAVTKWESGRGCPDIENLAGLASLFGVSVDHLLAGTAAPLDGAVLREPVDLASLEPWKPPGKPFGSRAHAAVRQVHPDAEIWPLSRARRNNRVQEGIEWVLAFAVDGSFGLFGAADGLSDRSAYYLVEHKGRQLLARVTKEAVESRALAARVEGRTFAVGENTFRRVSAHL